MSKEPAYVHCSHNTKAGRTCRGWAVRDSDPPTCSLHMRSRPGEIHRGQARSGHPRPVWGKDTEGPARSSLPVSGSLEDGSEPAGSSLLGPEFPENAVEPAGSSPPGPASPEDVSEPGFYDQALSDEELADLVMYEAELTLDDEIACTRAAVRRTLELLNERPGSLSESEYLRAAGVVFQGTRTIARLLREQQALSGGSDGRFQEIMDAALDGLSEQWGIEL